MDPEFIPIDMWRVRTCFALLRGHDRVSSVMDIIKKTVNAGEIHYYWGKKQVFLEEAEMDIFERFWRQEGNLALEWIYCCGLVPYTRIEKQTNRGKMVLPKVLDPLAGVIYYSRKQDLYKWVNTYGLAPMPEFDDSVVILSAFDKNPDIEGRIRTQVSAMLNLLRMEMIFCDCAVRAERINSNPPYIFETNPALDKVGGADDVVDWQVSKSEEKMRVDLAEERETAERYKNDNAFFMNIFGNKHKAEYARQNNLPLELLLKGWDNDNQFSVPYPKTLVQGPRPTTRGDFIPLMQYFDERVCTDMEVPVSILKNALRTADDSSSMEQWKLKVKTDKRCLEVVYSAFYASNFAESDSEYIMREYRTHNIPVTEMNVFEIQRDNAVRIKMPMPPLMTRDEIIQHQQAGTVTDEEFIKLMREVDSLPTLDDAVLKKQVEMINKKRDAELEGPAKKKSKTSE